jgi:hypothetical protein
MKTIFIVGVSDCEANSVVRLCLTKKIAEREILKERDRLVEDWKKLDESYRNQMKEFCDREGLKCENDDMYSKMIENLSSDDYESWDNYPHKVPYIEEREVIEK